jgi:hypothetical protein
MLMGWITSADSSSLFYFKKMAFALCITRIRVRLNTYNISDTRDRVSIDAGLKSIEADRVLYLNSRRDKKRISQMNDFEIYI